MRYLWAISISVFVVSVGCSFTFADTVGQLCNRVSEIKTLLFKDEHVDDEVYNGLVHAGKDAAQCLAEKILDTTIMLDPRKAPPYEGLTVTAIR